MPRPKMHGERVNLAIRVTPELHAALHEAAQERGVSSSLLANKAIQQFLDRLIPVEEIQFTRPVTVTDVEAL